MSDDVDLDGLTGDALLMARVERAAQIAINEQPDGAARDQLQAALDHDDITLTTHWGPDRGGPEVLWLFIWVDSRLLATTRMRTIDPDGAYFTDAELAR